MSLINEALKKAQKQRAADEAARSGAVPPPGVGGLGSGGGAKPPPPPPRPPLAPAGGGEFEGEDARAGASAGERSSIARSRRAGAGRPRWVVPAGAAVVLTGLLVAGFWALGGDADAEVDAGAEIAARGPTPAVERAAAIEPVAAEIAAEPQGKAAGSREQGRAERAAAIEPVAVPESTPPAVAAVVPSTAEATRSTPSPPRLAEDPVQRIPERAVGAGLTILTDDEATTSARVAGGATNRSARAAAQPNEAVLRYLERARVTGVRLSATDPKVLFNDRVYRLEEIVDRDLQLRLIGIADRELQFRDPQGYVYTKRF